MNIHTVQKVLLQLPALFALFPLSEEKIKKAEIREVNEPFLKDCAIFAGCGDPDLDGYYRFFFDVNGDLQKITETHLEINGDMVSSFIPIHLLPIPENGKPIPHIIQGQDTNYVWSQREISEERKKEYSTRGLALDAMKKESEEFSWMPGCLRVVPAPK